MQLVVDLLPDFASEHVHQILRRGLLHRGKTSESFDEQATTLVADARQIIELAMQHAFRATAPMR